MTLVLDKMKIKIKIKPTKSQEKALALAHKSDCKVLVCRWGRQSGKTVFQELMLIEYLCKPKTYNVYISPTFQLGRKIYKELTALLEGTGIIKKSNSSTLTIETIFGSTLQCFSMESYTAIRGTTCSGVLCLDECAYYSDVLPNGEEPWANVIFPITKARKPLVIATSTPASKRGLFWDFWCRCEAHEKGYYGIKATIMDDSLVTPEEIEEIRKSISEIAWRQEFMVEFLDSALTFFKGYGDCFTNFEFDENCKQWYGLDLAGNGQDATILTRINEKNQVKQYKIEGSFSKKYDEISSIINNTKNLVAIYAEQNGIGAPMIEEIRNKIKEKSKLHEWLTTNTSKEEIISKLAVDIEKKDIHFDTEDKQLYNELGSFVVSFTKTGKMSFQAFGTAHDDRCMSLAIANRCKDDFKYDKTFATVLNF